MAARTDNIRLVAIVLIQPKTATNCLIYVSPLKCRRGLVSRSAARFSGVAAESAFGFASPSQSDATAVEIARRQPEGYTSAHKISTPAAYIAARLCGIGTRGTFTPALVPHCLYQHWRCAVPRDSAAA